MRFVAQPPSAALRAHVAYLWSVRDTPAHTREQIVPSGTVELVINLVQDRVRIYAPGGAERTLRGAVVSGCYTRAFAIDARAHADIIGVHFRPGGAVGLLGAPGALANDHVELDALWGRETLRERLCDAPSLAARFAILDDALCRHLSARQRRRDLAWATDALAAGARVEAVVAELGLSARRFIELFTRDVGMTPKRFAMVQRFQRARAMMGPTPCWARIALACDYYDQAHLCRDWRALTGLSPAAYAAARTVEVKEHHVVVGSTSSKPRAAGARTVER